MRAQAADLDRTDLPLVTIDPVGSTDLDQVVHVARTPGGYRVSYAIADVGAFVAGRRLGDRFEAVVVDAGASNGLVQVREPAVRARCEGADLPLGERLQVELVTADPDRRTVLFRRV